MALEARLGQELRLRQQLVMTPQLQQAIKILQLPIPELEAVVQKELEQNPMLEPLDRATGESSADGAGSESSPGSLEAESTDVEASEAREKMSSPEVDATEAQASSANGLDGHDAAVELKEHQNLDKFDWREYLENYSNNWQDGVSGGGANRSDD